VNGNAILVLGILNGTAFYVLGTCLALLAVVVTAIGLLSPDAFSSKAAVRGVLLLFAVLVVATATFALRYSRDEQADRREKIAAEVKAQAATPVSAGGSSGASQAPAKAPAAKGPGGTVKVSADPTQLAFQQKTLTTKPGKVTLDFDNPAQIQHDVVIAQGSKVITKTNLISGSKTSTSADLAAGTYVFYCDVPGHREAGMQGNLTVK
jgi:plastocyanin